MAVTAALWEEYSTSTTTATSYLNFLSSNSVASGSDATTNPIAYPIQIPASSYAYSYEKWFWLLFAGNSNAITSIYFWRTGTYNTGYQVKALVKTPTPTVYATAIATTSTYAGTSGNEGTTTNNMPTTQGAGLTPTYNASGTKSDFIVAQLVVASTAGYGVYATGSPTINWQYSTTG